MTILQRVEYIPWKILPDWITGNRLRILMYHSISDNAKDPHAISRQRFEEEMRFLRSQQVVSLTEALSELKTGQSFKHKWVITFDDGLLDFYTSALPILKEYDFPATMFIPTGLAGTSAKWDSYDQSKPLMNWQQIESCQKWKITFGSHTVHHQLLTKCNRKELLEECEESLSTLEKRLTCTIRAIAYPGGYHDENVHAAVREAGYVCGLIASSRWGNGKETDLFQLRRERFDQ